MTTTIAMNREGFWYSSTNKLLPKPEASEIKWAGRKRFLASLAAIERGAKSHRYRGWSGCRLCECHNGSVTYEHNGWQWPQGLLHYVQEHNVRPSLAFQEMVLGKDLGE